MIFSKIAFVVMLLFPTMALSNTAKVLFSVPDDNIFLAQPFFVELEIIGLEKGQVVRGWPGELAKSGMRWGSFAILGVTSNGNRYRYSLVATTLGESVLPKPLFKDSKGQVLAVQWPVQGLKVNVDTRAKTFDSDGRLAAPNGPMAPFNLGAAPLHPGIWWGLAAVVLGILVLFWKLYQNRKKRLNSPISKALKALDGLQKKWQEGSLQAKDFLAALDGILREYLTLKLQIHAKESTPKELQQALLSQTQLSASLGRKFKPLLQSWTEIKFASKKQGFDTKQGDQQILKVRTLIHSVEMESKSFTMDSSTEGKQ